MIEVDTLAQAIDESQQEGDVARDRLGIAFNLGAAGKALVDIAISLRQIAGRPLPDTTPRQEQVARLVDKGGREIPSCFGRFDNDYVEEVMRRMLSDGLSDTDPSPSAGKPGKHADGAKIEQTRATEEEAEELYERWKRQYEEGRR